MLICSVHGESYRTRSGAQSHYAHRHLFEYADFEAYLDTMTVINVVTLDRPLPVKTRVINCKM